MTVDIQLAGPEQRYVLQNIWPAYMHDLSQYQDHRPNQHGLLDEEGITAYLPENFFQPWPSPPEDCSVFLIYADKMLAGCAVVVSSVWLKSDADRLIHDFFLFHAYRGKGIGQSAASQIFDRFKGSWQLNVLPRNKPALAFWRKTLSAYTKDDFIEQEKQWSGSPMIVFSFG